MDVPKKNVKKQRLPKCNNESLPRKQWILKKCLHLRLDNPFKQLILNSSSNDETKGSISVVYVVWEKTKVS